jgi:uncharacterized membrane protein YhaH (DUF805 family)
MFKFFFSAKGRFNRSQWWIAHIIILPLVLIGIVPILILGPSYHGVGHIASTLYNIVMVPSCFALFVVANIKRFHDRGKSGWWWLMVFIPGIGSAWHFIECGFFVGDAGPNFYGPSPVAIKQANNNSAQELELVRANLEAHLAKQLPATKPQPAILAGSKPAPTQYHDRPRDKQSLFSR